MANPQAWKAPRPRVDADELLASPLPLWVHAPYLINLASPDETVWQRSVQLLGQVLDVASSVGARGVVVHGGSPTGTAPDEGVGRWRRALLQLDPPVPVLIEHTAGRTTLVRTIEDVARLWEAIGDLHVGVVFDTCHAYAGGAGDLVAFAEGLQAAAGRIDLTHGNDSRDDVGSGRDRHEHLGRGMIDPGMLVESLVAAKAPVVLETPLEGRLADLAWLRGRLGLPPLRPA